MAAAAAQLGRRLLVIHLVEKANAVRDGAVGFSYMGMLCFEHESRAARARALVVACALVSAACGAPGFARPLAQAPDLPGEQAKCRIAASQDNPLVTEWPAPEKANLEARMHEGSVVVAYSGCTLRMLPRCRATGTYQWRRTTTSTDVVEIRNADDLYAKMPLGAVTLEGELQRSGRLAVQTTVSGQFKLEGFDADKFPRSPDCLGATHVVGALTVGAFKLHSGGAASIKAHAGVGNYGGGASSSSEETLMREAGAPARCEEASETAPHAACASPVQMFLQPLPSNVVDRGPAGTMKVKFLPVRTGQAWDVVVGDRKLCTTPCEKWVDPAMPYSLKYDPGAFRKNELLDLPDLRAYTSMERIEIRPKPTDAGELIGGILLTTFGGIAAVTGTALTSVGCVKGGGLCAGGLITLTSGLLLLAPGIFLILDSKGTIKVSPMPAEAAPPFPLRD